MVERAGTSCALSVILVMMATVVLHRVEKRGELAAIPGPIPRKTPPPRIPSGRSPEPPRPPTRAAEVAKQDTPRRPQSLFTRANAGESLPDVARRVYGAGVNVGEFWKLNRDQVDSVESALKPGMLLRTPDL